MTLPNIALVQAVIAVPGHSIASHHLSNQIKSNQINLLETHIKRACITTGINRTMVTPL